MNIWCLCLYGDIHFTTQKVEFGTHSVPARTLPSRRVMNVFDKTSRVSSVKTRVAFWIKKKFNPISLQIISCLLFKLHHTGKLCTWKETEIFLQLSFSSWIFIDWHRPMCRFLFIGLTIAITKWREKFSTFNEYNIPYFTWYVVSSRIYILHTINNHTYLFYVLLTSMNNLRVRKKSRTALSNAVKYVKFERTVPYYYYLRCHFPKSGYRLNFRS